MSGAALAVAAAVFVLGARLSSRLRPSRWPTESHPLSRGRRSAIRRRAGRRTLTVGDLAAAAWCDDAARSLRAGSSLGAAIAEASTAHPAMSTVTDSVMAAVSRGRTLAEALAQSSSDPATPAGLALTVLRSCAELGGPAASPLERVAVTLRTRAAIAEEQLAHSAQARLSARVLTLVPVALLALLAVTEQNVRGALVTPGGATVVVLGAILNVCGWAWMRRIIGALE